MSCTVGEELMETAQSRLEKLAPRSREVLARQELRYTLQLYLEPLLTRRRSEIDAEILVSQACETRAADRCGAFLLKYECLVLVCSVALFVGELPSSVGYMPLYDASSVRQMPHTPRGAS